MVAAHVPNAVFKHLAMNSPGLFQVALFNQDLAEHSQNINSLGMVASQAESCAVENLLQQVDGSVDVTGAPHRDGQFVSRRERLRMFRAQQVGMRIQRVEKRDDASGARHFAASREGRNSK